jgi:hypothetical protein
VHPSISIVAENPVAVVERTVNRKGTGELAKAYLQYLYSEEAQEIAAQHALRPRSPAVLKKYASTFKPLQLFRVEEYFGSLAEAQKVHFNDGGQFDKSVHGQVRHAMPRVLPGFNLTLGYTLLYLSLIVLIPLTALVFKTFTLSWEQFWAAVASPRVLASYRLTFGARYSPRW